MSAPTLTPKRWAELWLAGWIATHMVGPNAEVTSAPLPPYRKPEPWEYRPEFRP